MKAKLHLVFSITILFSGISVHGQQAYWKNIPTTSDLRSPSIRDGARVQRAFALDRKLLEESLEGLVAAKGPRTVHLPGSGGEPVPFRLRETPVMHPDLARKYPGIRSFTGISPDGRYKIKLSSSPKGLQSMVMDLRDREVAFMEPATGAPDTYVLYRAGDSELQFLCATGQALAPAAKTLVPLVGDGQLRRFRIAVSTTGEYTAYHGGTKAGALAAINATLTRVNAVFENDLGVSLELVADNDLVVFTDAGTDPYTNNFNAQVQGALSANIGEANYDVGHLFHRVANPSQNNGHAGFIGSVCTDNRKGSAFSAASIPQGDGFDLDFVSHELGHQFGANHTWSFESEGSGVQAEPASGSTIMGYAGIVSDNNVTPHGDSYFHYYSILQIRDYLATTSCAQIVTIPNAPPQPTPMGDYTIPMGTAFVLEGEVTDPDPGDVLTYTWEQIDDGVVTRASFGPENASGANFRSRPPSTDPKRYFPMLREVALGKLTQTLPEMGSAWETVSTIARDLNFALTVRDNAPGGGQVVSDLLQVKVTKGAGPFVVTSQDSPQTFSAGSVQPISWEVANTDSGPIDAHTVDIFLSLDGGLSFPILLDQNVLNDGSHEVQLPQADTQTGRFMVKAGDNIFFAVNTADFSIGPVPLVLEVQGLDHRVCQGDDLVIPLTFVTDGTFAEPATFSAALPPGLNATFDPVSAGTDGALVQMTLSNTAAAALGTHEVVVHATSATQTASVNLSVAIQDGTFPALVQTAPLDGATGTALGLELQWELQAQATAYQVQIAKDAAFTSIVEVAERPFGSYRPMALEEETQYFWRVRPLNACGTGPFTAPLSFTTISVDCRTFEAKDLPLEIPTNMSGIQRSSIHFFEDLRVSEVGVQVELDHTYLGDLIVSLISPQGTRVALVSNSCGELNNMNVRFADGGDPLACNGNPAINGTVRPLGSLASLKGESLLGEWVLEVQDLAPGDGGSLKGFSLEICGEGSFRPDLDGDGVFDDGDDLCPGTPKGVEVDVHGCPVYRFPADNFALGIQGESCRDADNGSLTIAPMNTSITYSATLTGPSGPWTAAFNNGHSFTGLQAGAYELCITGTNGAIDYRESCFQVQIDQPDVLDMEALVQQGMVDLLLRGAENYRVELNGQVVHTTSPQLRLPLREGSNTLKVSSDLACQGSMERTLFHSTRPILSPNPVGSSTTVHLGGHVGPVGVEVFTVAGRLVHRETRQATGGDIELQLSNLPRGIYYVRLERHGATESFKMIKQ